MENFLDNLEFLDNNGISSEEIKWLENLYISALNMYKIEDTSMTKEDKIESYINYCKKMVDNKFKHLSPQAKYQLDIINREKSTSTIIKHLSN